MEESENIALYDMDGTLCDYQGQLTNDVRKMQSPEEDPYTIMKRDPDHIREMIQVIRKVPGWWRDLPKFQLGFDVWELTTRLGFRNCVATKGPYNNPPAWGEKMEWCKNHLPSGTVIHITEDKSALYGRVLVDDWPPYIKAWLKHRPRGLVVMPAHPYNEEFKHPQVVRYDGSKESFAEVQLKLIAVKK